jgi:hypothetical protein
MLTKLPLLLVTALLLALTALSGTASASPTTPDVRLLAIYEPLMQFDPLEQFLPTKVESFIRDADLEQLTGPNTWTLVEQHAAPGDLPETGVWRLNEQPCTPAAPVGGLACYVVAATPGSGGPTIYGHVVHEDGETVLEYWFFYYDDVYSYTYPPSDLFWQAHEGDWEEAMVVLSGDERPLSVGYSQHCLGQTRTWADTPRFGGTHPIVHVAVGSHANYFSAGVFPINPACIPPAAIAVLQARGLPLPADYAFAGPTAGPPGSGGVVMPVQEIGDDVPSWAQFPGFWGEAQYFHAPAPIGTVALGNSPVGPAFHPEWNDPLGTLATWPAG